MKKFYVIQALFVVFTSDWFHFPAHILYKSAGVRVQGPGSQYNQRGPCIFFPFTFNFVGSTRIYVLDFESPPISVWIDALPSG